MTLGPRLIQLAAIFLSDRQKNPDELQKELEADDDLYAELLIQLMDASNKRCRNRSVKLLANLCKSNPGCVIRFWGRLTSEISSPANIVSWNAMTAVGYLSHLKTKKVIAKTLPALYGRLSSSSMVTIGHAIDCIGKMSLKATDSQEEAVEKLLNLKSYAPSEDCEQILAGKVIQAVMPVCDRLSKNKKELLIRFAKAYNSSPRNTTRRLVSKLTKKLDK